jgi:2-polyprenyl-3-methyl-5-hydroxy-6-metoxy-1,4-benzoquinol methylase
MSNTNRVDKTLFREDHYLGKPANDEDRIISRRIEILEQFPGFFGKDLTCIEAGCGAGATINRLSEKFNYTVGIDIFDYAAQFEQQKIKHAVSNSSFKKIDLEKDLPSEKFDRLISFEVIEHLKDENSVAAYFKVLNDGGIAAITVPNKWWIFETHGARLPLLPWNRVPFFSWLPSVIHERYANARIYTSNRIINLLKKHGFTILEHSYVTAPMDVLKNGWLKRMMTRYIFKKNTTAIPFLATSVFVLAQKNTNPEKING